MASPPFDYDVGNPTNSYVVSAYPENERVFRDTVKSAIDEEHESSSGRHQIPQGNSTALALLVLPPNGMLFYNTTSSKLQINLGTSGSPMWTNVA